MDIKDKTIIITGAARGLGAAMAKRLASHNCNLGLIDLDKDSIADTASACESAGAKVMCISADVHKWLMRWVLRSDQSITQASLAMGYWSNLKMENL